VRHDQLKFIMETGAHSPDKCPTLSDRQQPARSVCGSEMSIASRLLGSVINLYSRLSFGLCSIEIGDIVEAKRNVPPMAVR
jgi:hypothetical protein